MSKSSDTSRTARPAAEQPPKSSRAAEANLFLYLAMWAVWAIGLGVTLFLKWSTSDDGLPPGCGSGGGCGVVLTSDYSRVLGVSLTTWAIGFYIAAGIALVAARFSFQVSLAPPFSLLLAVATAVGVGAGVWSIAIMAFKLNDFCMYCLTLHGCNFVFFVLAIIYARQDWQHRQYRRWKANVPLFPSTPILMHAALAVLLVSGQAVAMSLFHSGPSSDKAHLVAVKLTSDLDIKSIGDVFDQLSVDGKFAKGKPIWTSKGPRDAKHRIVTYSCFTCPHCKRVNNVVKAMMKRYPGQLRVDMRFFPLWKCNKLMNPVLFTEEHKYACKFARFAVAVAIAEADKFEQFADWAYDNQGEITDKQALEKAHALVGKEKFEEALQSEELWMRSRQDISLGAKFGLTGVPNIFLPKGQVYGGLSFDSLETLFMEQFGWEQSDVEVQLSEEDQGIVVVSGKDLFKIAQAGRDAETKGRYQLAVQKYERALELRPDWVPILLDYAWLLSTCRDNKIFDGDKADEIMLRTRPAVEALEKHVNEMPNESAHEKKKKKQSEAAMGGIWAQYHEVTAAVHAANDRFRKAELSLDRAIRYSKERRKPKVQETLEKRLHDFYRRNKQFRSVEQTPRGRR